jgi:hypothetical protein
MPVIKKRLKSEEEPPISRTQASHRIALFVSEKTRITASIAETMVKIEGAATNEDKYAQLQNHIQRLKSLISAVKFLPSRVTSHHRDSRHHPLMLL